MNNKPARKLTTADIKITTDRVRCLLTNATMNLPQYSRPGYRVMNIQQAITHLQCLERMLLAEEAMENMTKER